MGNVLQFSLGLALGNFLSNLGKARDGVSGLVSAGLKFPVIGTAVGGVVGSFASLDKVVEKTFDQIEKGAALQGLHRRTGESVQDLFSMQKGFKAVLGASDSVPFAIFQMQKALGGFNEFGEPTKDIFEAMGLEVTKLKALDAPAQFEAITRRLAGLNKEEATLAASKIFGRSASGDVLQIARGLDDYTAAVKGAAGQAALFQRNAEAFHKIEISLEKLKAKANGVFASLAEAAAPGIQSILDFFNKIDLSNIGKGIGQFITAFGQSIKQGKLTELLELSLEAGFEQSVNYFGKLLQSLFASLPQMMEAGIKGGTGFFNGATAAALDLESMMFAKAGNALPVGSPMREEYMQLSQDSALMADRYRQEGAEKISEAFASVGKAVQAAMQAETTKLLPETRTAQFKALVAQLAGSTPTSPKEAGVNSKGLLGDLNPRAASTKDTNALERVGLLFFSQNRADYAQQTATNTSKLVQLVDKVLENIKRQPNVDLDLRNA